MWCRAPGLKNRTKEEATMRTYVFAIALCLCCVPAKGDSVTIDFGSLAADAGSVISTEFTVGPYNVAINDSLVIDDGGVIGVLPETTGSYDVYLQPTGFQFVLPVDSITMNFAVGTSSTIDWNGYETQHDLQFEWTGTAPDSITNNYSGSAIGTIFTEAGASNGAQLTSITIVYTFGAVPEPASAILAGIGVLGIAVLARRRWR
jgi:PEP-CTERM motif